MEGQRPSGSDVGDTGVWHHRSIAVSVAAATSFSLEVQGQSSPAPGLFDLSLHLREQVIYIYSYESLNNMQESLLYNAKNVWGPYLSIAEAVYNRH